jgi:hypothetical protein
MSEAISGHEAKERASGHFGQENRSFRSGEDLALLLLNVLTHRRRRFFRIHSFTAGNG